MEWRKNPAPSNREEDEKPPCGGMARVSRGLLDAGSAKARTFHAFRVGTTIVCFKLIKYFVCSPKL
ncbi:MAG: hypothetical protein N3D85_01485 [Candidatus Bathyarchaeota archaeon]|nr:hypothetical protein [Candidatus Bathyarchaeota archaeon]